MQIQPSNTKKIRVSEITPFIWMHIQYLSGNSLNHFFWHSSRCARPLKGWQISKVSLFPLPPCLPVFSDEVRSRPSSAQDAACGWEKWEEGEEEAASDLPSPHIEEGRSSWGKEDASMAPRHGCASGHQEASWGISPLDGPFPTEWLKKYQNTTNMLLRRLPFQKLVREIC